MSKPNKTCTTCQYNTTGNITPKTCKKMCYLRYSAQRRKRICDLEKQIKEYKKVLEKIEKETDGIIYYKGGFLNSKDYMTAIVEIKSIIQEVLNG